MLRDNPKISIHRNAARLPDTMFESGWLPHPTDYRQSIDVPAVSGLLPKEKALLAEINSSDRGRILLLAETAAVRARLVNILRSDAKSAARLDRHKRDRPCARSQRLPRMKTDIVVASPTCLLGLPLSEFRTIISFEVRWYFGIQTMLYRAPNISRVIHMVYGSSHQRSALLTEIALHPLTVEIA